MTRTQKKRKHQPTWKEQVDAAFAELAEELCDMYEEAFKSPDIVRNNPDHPIWFGPIAVPDVFTK